MAKLLKVSSIKEDEVVASFSYEGKTYSMGPVSVDTMIHVDSLSSADESMAAQLEGAKKIVCLCFPDFPEELCGQLDPNRLFSITNHIMSRISAQDEDGDEGGAGKKPTSGRTKKSQKKAST